MSEFLEWLSKGKIIRIYRSACGQVMIVRNGGLLYPANAWKV